MYRALEGLELKLLTGKVCVRRRVAFLYRLVAKALECKVTGVFSLPNSPKFFFFMIFGKSLKFSLRQSTICPSSLGVVGKNPFMLINYRDALMHFTKMLQNKCLP